MTAKKFEGYRTLFGFLVAVVALVVGLHLLAVEQRGAAFGAFSIGIVGLFTGLAARSSVAALAGGGGVKGAVSALMTDAKPEGSNPAPKE